MISICSILYVVQFHSYSFCLFWVGLLVYLFESRCSISERGILKLPTITLGLSLPLSVMSTQCLYPQSNIFINIWCPSLSLWSRLLCNMVSLGRGRAMSYFVCSKCHFFYCSTVCVYFCMCLWEPWQFVESRLLIQPAGLCLLIAEI